jgi:hypothetical protein
VLIAFQLTSRGSNRQRAPVPIACLPNDIAVQRRAHEGGPQGRPTRPSVCNGGLAGSLASGSLASKEVLEALQRDCLAVVGSD